jgi:hypothetical protein
MSRRAPLRKGVEWAAGLATSIKPKKVGEEGRKKVKGRLKENG